VALTTKIIDGDILMLRVGFADGMIVTMTVGRNGKSVTVTPNDPETTERLSSIFHWSADKVGEPGYPFTSLSQVIYGMETLARSAINKASIGWAAEPPEPTRDKDVMDLLSGLKGARMSTDEDLALLVMEVAHHSSDIAMWLESLRSTTIGRG
jgi:hypothetical protein